LGSQSGNIQAYINLSDGSIGTTGVFVIEAKTENLGGGWYRCSMTYSGTATIVRAYPAQANGNLTATSGNIYIQDAQLEKSMVATDYIETGASTAQAGILEDMPRLDYSGGASCPSLLLEPQRTNLCIQSEYAGSWSPSGTGTITENAAVSPEGVQNAFTLNDTSNGAYYRIERNVSVSAGDNTLSVFIKKTTGALSHYAGVQLDTNRKYVIIDTTNGTWAEAGGTENDFIDIQDFSADYWRVIIRNNLLAGSTRVALWPALSTDGGTIAVGATGENTFYGIQVESGSYPTSYIPTYGSSVTRGVETTSTLTLPEPLTDNYTLFFDFKELNAGNGWISFFDSSNGGVYSFYSFGGHYDVYNGSAFIVDTSAAPDGKIALKQSGSSVKIFVNGVDKTKAGATANLTDIAKFAFGTKPSSNSGTLNQMLIFPTALTDSECIALTTI
jgi:hypothetical protein